MLLLNFERGKKKEKKPETVQLSLNALMLS
jgi:hypothetical protein